MKFICLFLTVFVLCTVEARARNDRMKAESKDLLIGTKNETEREQMKEVIEKYITNAEVILKERQGDNFTVGVVAVRDRRTVKKSCGKELLNRVTEACKSCNEDNLKMKESNVTLKAVTTCCIQGGCTDDFIQTNFCC